MYARNGLGAVFTADGTDFYYPWYCNSLILPEVSLLGYVPGTDCAPPTAAQLTAMQTAQLAQVAAVNPTLAAQGVAAGNAASAALAKTDPNAADYYAYQANPAGEALLGSSFTNWLAGIDPTNIDPTTGLPKSSGVPGWLILAGIGAVILWVAR